MTRFRSKPPKKRVFLSYIIKKENNKDDHLYEFIFCLVVAVLLLIGTLFLTIFWLFYYRDGFSWKNDPELMFNLHPLFMIIGPVFFSGISMILHRVCQCFNRTITKLLHTIFNILTIPCICLGFTSVLEHVQNKVPTVLHFYSLHSWLGLTTMGLYFLQMMFGFFSLYILLFCKNKTAQYRTSYKQIHAAFGIIIYTLAIASCLTGLLKKAIYLLGNKYEEMDEEGLVINSLAMCLMALGIVILYICIRDNFRNIGRTFSRTSGKNKKNLYI